jgi:hypothetical protein
MSDDAGAQFGDQRESAGEYCCAASAVQAARQAAFGGRYSQRSEQPSEPGSPSGRLPQRHAVACGNAGCAYIWLFNDANGYGEAEYQADPSIGRLTSGVANFSRYTQSNNSSSGWNDNMEQNCSIWSWCGYRYIYPIAGLPNGSWVHVLGVGTAIINYTIVASWGPVDTWNYITWH